MAHSLLLDGKVAGISGAASPRGIGLATARMFAKHGAKIAILDLDKDASVEAAASVGPEHRGYACNVSEKEACIKAAESVITAFGKIDILINNAGITQPAKVLDIDPESWNRILDVNLRGVLYLSQAVITGEGIKYIVVCQHEHINAQRTKAYKEAIDMACSGRMRSHYEDTERDAYQLL